MSELKGKKEYVFNYSEGLLFRIEHKGSDFGIPNYIPNLYPNLMLYSE